MRNVSAHLFSCPLQLSMRTHRTFILYRRRNPTEKWLREVPQLSMHLEYTLYRRARNMEEYSDINTLAARLRDVIAGVNLFREQHLINTPTPLNAPDSPSVSST